MIQHVVDFPYARLSDDLLLRYIRGMSQLSKPVKRNLKQLSDQVSKPYDNFILESVNDHCLRMSVMTGEYRWHYHANTDELFISLEGELKIEIRDADTVILKPGEFVQIPKGTIHKTSTQGRSVNLCFERSAEDTIFVD